MPNFPAIPLLLATILAGHGWRKKSLSSGGAIAAFIVGLLMLAVPLWSFGVSLIVFYLSGSRATKYGKKLKSTLEDGYHEAGYRTAWQVVCNSFAAFIAAVTWSALFAPDSIPGIIASNFDLGFVAPTYSSDEWCPLSPEVLQGASRALVFAALGHFACCLGDTLASELGILSPTPPILITTLKTVPPGTNGAMSSVGTLASIGGGLVMGTALFASLIAENVKCREQWAEIVIPLLAWGAVAGGLGSLLDSLMGATIQRTRYSSDTKRVLQDHTEPPAGSDIKVISGIDILTNNQVNLVSSILTSLFLAMLG